MVVPDAPGERDMRWLALMLSEKNFWQQIKADFETRRGGLNAVAAADAEVVRLDAREAP